MNKINGLRFIIGPSCNYNCFYCHHEGCLTHSSCEDLTSYEKKIQKLYTFCMKNGIYEIAITGGEPFLYFDKLSILFKYFVGPRFHTVINTNASLIHKYAEYVNNLTSQLEFHINFSSLNPSTHHKIIQKNLYYDEIKSLKIIDASKHIIKLNIICLKSINDKELNEIKKFAKINNFIPRFLVFYDSNNKYSNLVMNENEICDLINAKIYKKYGYGIILAKSEIDVEIVKCLCINKECEICKNNTFLHIDPNLNIKYCLNLDDVVNINYDNNNTIIKSFKDACVKLEEI